MANGKTIEAVKTGIKDLRSVVVAGKSSSRWAPNQRTGWQDGNACTIGRLRGIFPDAYTDQDRQSRGVETPARPGQSGWECLEQAETRVNVSLEEIKQFPNVERRRNPGVPVEHREAGEVAVFQELGKALTSSLQLDQVLRTIMEKIDEFLRPDNWSLLLLDEGKQELYFELAVGKASQALKDVRIKLGQGIAGWVAQHGEVVIVPDTSKDTRFFGKVDEKTKMETQLAVGKASQALKDVRIRLGQGIAGWVAQHGEVVIVPDTSKDTRFFGKVDEKTKMETRSIVAVPVRFRDTCLGVIELINCVGPEGFDPRDLKLLEALSDFAAIALENARHVKRIHELTIKDDCTSLYNARHMGFILDTEIYRSQRYNYEFSIVFIDLDHFKQVNDTHGHLVGSRLLSEMGDALKGNCRLIDFAFRYGGDEFVILLPQTSKENAINVAQRLHRLIRETVWLSKEGLNIRITPSIGLAAYPMDSKTKEGLLHLADEAMYLVKNKNRDSVAAANIGILPVATGEAAG